MMGHFGHRHHLAQLINVIGQPSGNPDIGVKQFKVLDADPTAYRTIKLAVMAIKPDGGCCQVEITNPAFSPAVGGIGPVSASVTNRFKAPVRQYFNRGLGCIDINALIDNFYSTKGKIRCYG
jgi:hypothetical protein